MKVGKPKECMRCGNKWRSKLQRPKQCPRCKQTEWDRPARAKKLSACDKVVAAQDSIFDAIGSIGKMPVPIENQAAEPAKPIDNSFLDFELV